MRASTVQATLDIVERAHAEGHLCVARPQHRKQLAHAAEAGLLVRPYPQVYATREHWEGLVPERKVLLLARALSVLNPSWVFAGTTAALAHGLSVGRSHLDRVCIAQFRGYGAWRNEAIRRITVSKDDPVMCQGLHVTSFLRTVYDCIRLLPFPDALAIADSALRTWNISCEHLQDIIAQRYGRMPGARRVEEIIGLADGRAENGGESFARAQMIALGFVVPDLQRQIPDPLRPGKGYRADFAWDLPDGSMVVGELDGRDKYTNVEMTGGKSVNEVLFDERRREAHVTLSSRPVRVMRFTLAETKELLGFERLLTAYGVPRVVAIPEVARR